jgi:transposase
MSEKTVKPRVSDKDFVAACLAGKSCADVAASTGLAVASVCQRAARLRKAGVKLAKYDRKARSQTDVDALNAMIGS